jgi:hypothetical protein
MGLGYYNLSGSSRVECRSQVPPAQQIFRSCPNAAATSQGGGENTSKHEVAPSNQKTSPPRASCLTLAAPRGAVL